jgi:hypothetical protein
MARRPTYTAANVIRLHREPDTWAGPVAEPERCNCSVLRWTFAGLAMWGGIIWGLTWAL